MSDPSTNGAQLHGPGGLLSTPGLGGVRRKKWGKRAKAACTCGTTTKAGEPGEHIAPGITRIRGNLCNVHGKYGPCDAGETAKPKKGKGRKPRAAAKPKKVPVTPEQRAAATVAKRQANIDSVAQQMAANDTGLAPGGVKALTAFAEGTQPDAQTGANLAKLGLAEQARDGSYRMTPTGRAAVSAMQAGDYQRTVDTISRGTDASSARGDRAMSRTARQQASADKRTATAAQRQARQAQVTARRAKKKAPSTPTTDAAPTIPHATPVPSRSAAPKAGAHVQAPKGQAATPAPTKAPAVDTARNLTNVADATGLGDNLSNLDQFSQGKALRAQDVAYLVVQGLLENAADGPRQTAQGKALLSAAKKGDMQSAKDALSRARERATTKAQTPEEKAMFAKIGGSGSGGGGGGAWKKGPDDKRHPSGAQVSAMQSKLDADKADLDKNPPKDRVALSKRRTELRTRQEALDDHRERADHALDKLDHQIRDKRNEIIQRQRKAKPNQDGTRSEEQKYLHSYLNDVEGSIQEVKRNRRALAAAKSFTVYKDHAGRPRWIARTTTAYQDRDNEIISEAALDADSARMTTTKVFGPLRWWHVGTPDPLNDAQPWGVGLDIGDCDYSTLIGRTRVESGTFRNDAIAEKVARAAEHLEMSPGFFHPLDQPRDGVFSTIRTFERSLVPTRYARASNLFTGFTVKECSMEANEMERRFKAAITDLGLDAAQAATLGQQLVATEKTAQAQGIAFKSAIDTPETMVVNGVTYKATLPPEEDMPRSIPQEVTINGVVYKAFPPAKDTAPMADAGMTSVEEKAPPVEDVAVDLAPPEEMEPEGNYVGDMDADTFFGMLDERLAPIIKLQDMLKTMGDMHSELKGMYGGTVTKEAGNTAEITALKARLAELEGRQPATILPDEVTAAMKSAGPSDPAQPENSDSPHIESTVDRPMAGAAAALFPEAYGASKAPMTYGPNGWQVQPTS